MDEVDDDFNDDASDVADRLVVKVGCTSILVGNWFLSEVDVGRKMDSAVVSTIAPNCLSLSFIE